MIKRKKSAIEKAQQVKALVDEIVSYVNSDLLQRNAERLLPGFSRENLFVKPKNWEEVFRHKINGNGNGHKNGEPTSFEFVLDEVIAKAQDDLLSKQHPEEGYWCAPLRADTTLESDTITLYAYMGWLESKRDKIDRMANYILSQQLADGGWNIYKNGPSEISATVKGSADF